MKKLFFSLILYTNISILSQTISSTAQGGNWNSPSTWIGGVAPNANSDVVINGPVVISNVECKNLTINSNGIIEDEPSMGRTLTINGDFINYGTVRIGQGNYGVTLLIKGNMQNYGTLINRWITFGGSGSQQILSTKKISCYGIDKNPDGTIIAMSDLEIDSVTTVRLDGDVLNMGSYKLSKISRKNIDNSGDIISGGTIYSNGQLDISGRFGSNLDGNPTLIGNTPLLFTGENTIKQNLTVASGKVLADEPYLGRTITIQGNLTNNGIITNRHGGLTVEVKGNVINNGEFTSFLRFIGDDNQSISGTQKYSCGWIEKKPDGKINAASDLVFDSTTTIYLYNDILNMGSYKLMKLSKKDFVSSDFIFKGGTIYSDGEIDVTGRFASNLDGDFILTGKDTMLFVGDNIIYHDLKVAKDKVIQDECCIGREFTVNGDIYNYGTFKNRFGGLTCYALGNVYNYGRFEISYLILKGDNNVTKLYGTFFTNIELDKEGSSPAYFTIDQFLNVKKGLLIKKDVTLTINNNSELIADKTISNYGTVINNGKITNRYYIYTRGSVDVQPFMKINPVVYDRATSDSLIVTSYNLLHPKMSSAIKRYWNVKGNKNLSSYSVELYYDDEILNGQDPNNLEVYITTDNGETWKKISNAVNTQRDLANKKITVGTNNNPITLTGDIILSSGNVANISSISVTITGRMQVRVGPPNRYTISYWNNNNYPTDKFFIILKTNQGVYFDGMYSKKIGTDSLKYIPIDSLVYDNMKDEILLLVQPLAPKEVRSFDVIVKSALGTSFKSMEPVTFTVIALWVGGAILEEYISNTVVNSCYEVWRPVEEDKSLTDASVKALKNSLNDAVTIENGAKGVAKKASEEILKKTGRIVAWPAFLAKDILDCLSNTVKGMKEYVNGNFDKQEKELVKVTSWDPNAKEGPTGHGKEGFISSAATMNYTIFFENKKEATAPAYQIVILDTLDENVFDINSVKFGDVSHPLVNKTLTRTGNILKWDFVGIELPPNVNPPEGEGWVKFTVNLKPNLPSETKIRNRAVITFDINKPLATNTVVNTLDFDSPSADITNISQLSSHELLVAWNGNDGSGSGVKNAAVYLSTGDGPFTLAAVSDKSPINIPVQPENSYRLYVLATDNVGNTQQSPAQIHQITVDVKEKVKIPKEYKLEQNYPNPFNPVTKIVFSIPKRTKAELCIYNILGEKVAELINAEIEAGRYEYEFNAVNLPSGVYFYRFKTEDYISVKKMLLIK